MAVPIAVKTPKVKPAAAVSAHRPHRASDHGAGSGQLPPGQAEEFPGLAGEQVMTEDGVIRQGIIVETVAENLPDLPEKIRLNPANSVLVPGGQTLLQGDGIHIGTHLL